MSGDSAVPKLYPIHGSQGQQASGNKPGARDGSVSWLDNSGNLWLFGGHGVTTVGTGYLNDLWKYDAAQAQWIFISGDNTPNSLGSYGIRGVSSPDNKPGGRQSGVTWTDNSGNLYLFGGYGYYSSSIGLLNDLWKYNIASNEWTWIKGDNSVYVPGIYGTKTVMANANNPGGRENAMCWKDANGKIWLFGGYATVNDNAGAYYVGFINDLWKYDPQFNQWTWMKGDSTIYGVGSFGSLGVPAAANNPGCRRSGVSWTDNTGKLWMFGGVGFLPGDQGNLSDLWRFDPATNNWTWMNGNNAVDIVGNYGTQGVQTSSNRPGCRELACSWTDATGNLWMFGGQGPVVYHGASGWKNDLWRYSVSSNQWTWMKGDTINNVYGVYGSQGVAAASNKPGGRKATITWADASGNLLLFGGVEYFSPVYGSMYNDLWSYKISNGQWTWLKGDNVPNISSTFGIQGQVSEGNYPGGRENSVTWKDAAGNFWLFGGYGITQSGGGYYNDLWKYNPSTQQWIYIKGDNSINNYGNYGTKGLAANTNKPGARTGSISWIDASGKLWLFGGFGYSASGFGLLNDLWRYDPGTNQWTWMKAENTPDPPGIYGNLGVPAGANNPGGRENSVSWVDATGNMWLFGGYAAIKDPGSNNISIGFINDLWRFEPSLNRWTWMKGDSSLYTSGSFGVQGTPSAGNNPSSRRSAVSWTDNAGKLWMFGGNGTVSFDFGNLNDLWRYDPLTNQWTWMKGDNTVDVISVYGSQGVTAASNKPGARNESVSWADAAGNLYLFGGYGSTAYHGPFAYQNDLWRYNVSTNNWTWMKGTAGFNYAGDYGTRGVASANVNPGARGSAVPWSDASGDLWMYGGYGNSTNGLTESNLLMRYDPPTNQWTWIRGEISTSNQGVYSPQGVSAAGNKPGARAYPVSWTDTSNNLWMFGGQDNADYLNDLWKYDLSSKQWTWMKGDSTKNVFTGVYGSAGVSASANKPGARSKSVSWTDSIGRLWLFGGMYSGSGPTLLMNDLWRYNPSNNQWTWLKGSSSTNDFAIYGSQSVPNSVNKPGAREGAVSWEDNAHNLWLFGGTGLGSSGGSGYLNDLWRYNTSTNQWTWMKGDNTTNAAGSYGFQGFPSSGNKPGARKYAVTWTDAAGNFYLFGGVGYGSSTTTTGRLNDLWRYNTGTNQWTWLRGSSTANAPGTYGTQGTGAAANTPGAREGSISWKDVYGNLWLFGGNGFTSSVSGTLNDLWKYTPGTNQWTWVKGDNNINLAGLSNKPGARSGSVPWTDNFGDFWLFGGIGYGTTGNGYLNDHWKIFAGTKFVFNGNGLWSDQTQWLDNNAAPTTITQGMDVVIDHEIPGACTVNGTVNLQPLGRLKIESGKLLTVNQGSINNEGEIEGPGNRPGKLRLTGIDTSTLRSPGMLSTPMILSNKKIRLDGNTRTSSIELTGTSRITLGNYDLDMDTSELTRNNNTSFIVTNGTGKLKRYVGSTPVSFPVGFDTSSFTPIIVTNTGTPDRFEVKVSQGVSTNVRTTAVPILSGAVNRTWYLTEDVTGGSNVSITTQWNASEELSGFNRNNCYVSQFLVCPPPPNCATGFYDEALPVAATGSSPYSITRTGITIMESSGFIVRSPLIYTFTGNGDWNLPTNWSGSLVPSNPITSGMEVVIDSPAGTCTYNGDITVQMGGKLTIKTGKRLVVTGKIIVQ